MSRKQSEPQFSTIGNGLRVATTSISDVETVAIGIWVDVGSRYESEVKSGISHFLEHMAFKGTVKRSAKQIALEFDNIGGILNAYTSRERTVYYAIVLKDDIELAIDILSDIMQNSIFEASELERERGVILQEIAQTNDTPDDVVFEHFQEKAYPEQSIGRSILGSKETVSAFGAHDLKSFMAENYCAEQMVLSVAGNIEHNQVVDIAKEKFTAIPSLNKVKPEKATYKGGSAYVQKDLEQVHLVLGFQGVEYMDDSKYYTQQLAANILGGSMSSRLFQEVREKRGLAYSISSFGSSYSDSGVMAIYAGTTENHVDELLNVACSEWTRATADITEDELQCAKNQVKAALLMSRDSVRARMEEMGSNILIHDRFISMQEILNTLETITVDMVQQSLVNCLKGSELTFAAIGNVKSAMPYEKLKELLVL